MNPHLNIAINIVRKLGKNIIFAFDQLSLKKMSNQEVEEYICFVKKKCFLEAKTIINKLYPDHKIILNSDDLIDYNVFAWIINLIDCEINFKKGLQEISLSIAILYKNCINNSVIYDPFNNNLFVATKNEGAKLNGKRIRVSNNFLIEHSLININFFHLNNYIYYCKYVRFLLLNGASLRTSGSLSLSLAYFASGIYDGYINFNVLKSDYNSIYACKLLVREAGGYISNFSGGDHIYNNILSFCPKLYVKLLKLFNNITK
ncbi:MAG TPA: inositol monophosphatase family protein [Candidatus Azosocius sp. HAIN]